MRLLLDTHIAIWAVIESSRLSATARDVIGNDASDVYISAISIAEIAIKRTLSTRKDVPPFSAAEALDAFDRAGFQRVDLIPAHAAMLEKLPPLHNDPFDRLLIAQAFAEPFRLVTHDPKVGAYGNNILLV